MRELIVFIPKDADGFKYVDDVWWDYIGPDSDICEGISGAIQAWMNWW